MADKLKVTLVKSPIGAIPKQKATVEALGLKKLNKIVKLQQLVISKLYKMKSISIQMLKRVTHIA